MINWYYKIVDDLSEIANFIVYFENELISARSELSLKGKSIEKHAAELPGIVEMRYSQLQVIESILEHLNILLRKKRSEKFKKFLESYAKALSSRDAEKYVDGEKEVIELSMLVNEVALLRNKYLGITKSLETKNFMISNITRLKVAGIDDATVY